MSQPPCKVNFYSWPGPFNLSNLSPSVGNYRPVSLTSVVSKVAESVIRDHIMDFLQSNDLINPNQHGFVPGRSCTTNLLTSLENWISIVDDGDCVDILYLDFRKAFDSVPHKRLLQKMSDLGIAPEITSWVQGFLTGRKQAVRIGDELSSWRQVSSGVPQGSVLGPCLFVIFINDMPDVVQNLLNLFADDSKMWRRVASVADCEQLQKDLDSLFLWSEKWQ